MKKKNSQIFIGLLFAATVAFNFHHGIFHSLFYCLVTVCKFFLSLSLCKEIGLLTCVSSVTILNLTLFLFSLWIASHCQNTQFDDLISLDHLDWRTMQQLKDIICYTIDHISYGKISIKILYEIKLFAGFM